MPRALRVSTTLARERPRYQHKYRGSELRSLPPPSPSAHSPPYSTQATGSLVAILLWLGLAFGNLATTARNKALAHPFAFPPFDGFPIISARRVDPLIDSSTTHSILPSPSTSVNSAVGLREFLYRLTRFLATSNRPENSPSILSGTHNSHLSPG